MEWSCQCHRLTNPLHVHNGYEGRGGEGEEGTYSNSVYILTPVTERLFCVNIVSLRREKEEYTHAYVRVC